MDDALYKLEEEISLSPYFLAQYILYKRNFLNGKFVMYYQVLEEENLIRIIYFRSNKQKPL
nr:type II toxin-antitoxin system RelE/ParE family toxin [Capnocytophaga sp. oral taxon 326]